MNPRKVSVSLLAALILASATAALSAGRLTPHSAWVYANPVTGKLLYKTTQRGQVDAEGGDRILDFSTAGYEGGGVALPVAPVRFTLSPSSSGDDAKAIQAAIDAVSASTPDKAGLRGAVLLKPGTYSCSDPITIAASGVVLRGSGSGITTGTTIKMTGAPHVCFIFSAANAASTEPKSRSRVAVKVTDRYAPSGTYTLHVADSSGFRPGDTVTIHRPITPVWLAFMGMDKLVRDGKPETWIKGETLLQRTIRAVSGNALTLDQPLSDSYDSRYLDPPGVSVEKTGPAAGIDHVGIESLHVICPPQAIPISAPQNQAVQMNGAVHDSWLRDLALDETINSIAMNGGTRRITLLQVVIRHTVATLGAALPLDYQINGSQILIDRCSDTGDRNFYAATGSRGSGPNVILHSVFTGNGHVQPHQRWSTGLLVDSCNVPGGGIDFMNRGQMGSGHGWTMGWGVAWNCVAKSFRIQSPPGSTNWAIGCRGARELGAQPFDKEPNLPEGIFDSHGTPVEPGSLYLAQLEERMGAGALRAIGY